MKKTLIFAAVAMLGIAALGATSTGGAGATKPDDDGVAQGLDLPRRRRSR